MQKTCLTLLQSLSRSDTPFVNNLLAYEYVKKEKVSTVLRDCRNLNIILEKHPLLDSAYDDISFGEFREIHVWYNLISQPDSTLNIRSAELRVDFYPYEFLENNSNRILNYKLSMTAITGYFALYPLTRDSLPFNFDDYQ